MKRVIIESPYAGDIDKNTKYVRACMRDCLLNEESPYASHALYTQEGVLADDVGHERKLGINAGFVWRSVADITAVYIDLGITPGMQAGIEHAENMGHEIVYRSIPGWERS
jgi:hypothetical protein